MSPLDLSKLAPVSAPAPTAYNGERMARSGSMPTGGRWGWYRDHLGNEFRRVSTMIKKVETDTYNLDQWKLRQVALGLAKRDDLMLSVKAMREPDEGWSKDDKRKLNGIVKEAGEAAKTGKGGARAGTAVHDLTERVDRGEPIEDVVRGLPAAAAQSLRAYEYLRRANGWTSVEIERTVHCEELEVAGTFDRVDLVPGLTALLGPTLCQYGDACPDFPVHTELPVIVDVKTEAQPWLNGLHIGPQLGIYSRARKMWRPLGGTVRVRYSASGDEVEVPAGEYVAAPCVRQDVAIVVHVLDGHAVPYFVNLSEGWEAAVAAYEQQEREARAGRRLGAAGAWFVPVPGIKFPGPAQMLTEDASARQLADPYRPPGLVTGEQVAVRGEDGLVRWQPALTGDEPVGTQVVVGGIEFTKHTEGLPAAQVAEQHLDAAEAATGLTRMLIEQIWKTVTVDGLAILWNMANDRDVPWRGPVAMAAEARRRQIECPQRALHAGGGKCACGWQAGIAA